MLANDVLWLLIVRHQLVDQFLIDRLLIRSLLASLIDSHFILLIGNFNGCLHTSFYTLRQRLMARFGAPAFSHPAMPSAPALTLTQWLSGVVGISSESQVVVVWFPPRFHTQYDDRVSRSCTKRFRILIAALLSSARSLGPATFA